jgi:hypothetical protein
VPGDFLVREGESVESVVARLDEVLRVERKLPVKLSFRDVARRVVVVRGRYQLHSATDQNRKPIVIAPAIPRDLDRLYSQAGDFDGFLDRVGRQVGMLGVADEVQGSSGSLSWLFTLERVPREETGAVLKLVGEQTGLALTETTRRVRILFVERAE